ncbi:MAG: hypothetical protein FWE35_10830 [Streptosporangiales bacterium]|nr:hypothetical protein [Streptosporangiales bacterium]
MKDWPVALVLAIGVAIALPASLIIAALHPAPSDPELIAVISTLAGAAVGAVGGYLAREHPEHGPDSPADGPGGDGHLHIPQQRPGS